MYYNMYKISQINTNITFIVKTVGNFMSDDDSNSTIVKWLWEMLAVE